MNAIQRLTLCIVAFMVNLLYLGGNAVCGEKPVNIQEIVERWKEKEKRMHDAVIEWTSHVITPKRNNKLLVKEFPELGEDSSFNAVGLLKVSGSTWRLESAGRENQTTVYDGRIMKIYMPTGGIDNGVNFPLGTINNADSTTIPSTTRIKPSFLMFRPLASKFIVPEKYQISPKHAIVNNIPCVLVEGKRRVSSPVNSSWTFYVAPSLDFAIIRWTVTNLDRVYIKADFDYKLDEVHGWIPERWSIVDFDGAGVVTESVTSEMKALRIGTPIDPSEFKYDFPPGTLVNDYTTKSDVAQFTQYIAREGGERRIVTRPDLGASYDDLRNSESGEAKLAGRWFFRSTFVWLSLLLIVLAASGVLLYRKTRRKSIS